MKLGVIYLPRNKIATRIKGIAVVTKYDGEESSNGKSSFQVSLNPSFFRPAEVFIVIPKLGVFLTESLNNFYCI